MNHSKPEKIYVAHQGPRVVYYFEPLRVFLKKRALFLVKK